MEKITITRFVAESNKIEGIMRPPTEPEIISHQLFLSLEEIDLKALVALTTSMQPDAELRNMYGLDVRVGSHFPPRGGPEVEVLLKDLIDRVNSGANSFATHCEYETLHPFTDGNGRSGRAIWAWQQYRLGRFDNLQRGFLHSWYYQTLQNSELRVTMDTRKTVNMRKPVL